MLEIIIFSFIFSLNFNVNKVISVTESAVDAAAPSPQLVATVADRVLALNADNACCDAIVLCGAILI